MIIKKLLSRSAQYKAERETVTRLVSLDAARAFAALLGIVLHASAGFLKYPVSVWPPFNNQSNLFFDCLAGAIHAFRVPIFFFLAGYFCFQLTTRMNLWDFIINRLKRIAIPFIIFSLLIKLPLLIRTLYLRELMNFREFFLIFSNVSYLWFLEYLIFCYAFFLVVMPLLKNKQWLNNLSIRHTALPIISVIFLSLYFDHAWYVPILLNFIPDPYLLTLYLIFFTLGFLLSSPDAITKYFNFDWRYLLIGIIAYICYMGFALADLHSENMRLIAIAFYATYSYFLFVSFLALCIKYFNSPNSIITFLAEASYWIYLSHIFFIELTVPVIMRLFSSIFMQFVGIVLFTTVLTLLSYRMIKKERYGRGI